MPAARRTADVKMPIRISDGQKDKRYKDPQFCKSTGQRDMRVKRTAERRK
jgi:hypothetical protein